MSDVVLGASLDMSDVAKALAKLPEMTSEEAEKAVRELTKTFDKASREAKKLRNEIRKSSKEGGDALKQMGERAGDADTAISGMASAIGLISPEAEAALRTLGDLSAGVEGFARGKEVLAAVGVTTASVGVAAAVATPLIIAGAAAWKTYADRAEEARVEAGRLRTALDGQGKAMEAFYDEVTQVDAALEEALSGSSDVERSEKERQERIRERAKALKQEAEAVRDAVRANYSLGEILSGNEQVRADLRNANEQYADTLERVNQERDRAIEASENLIMLDQAERAAAERRKEDAENQAKAAANAAKRAQAESLVNGLLAARLSPLEQINAQEQEVLKTLQGLNATETQLDAVRQEFSRRRRDLLDEEIDAEMDLNREAMESAIASVRAVQEARREAAEESKALHQETAEDAEAAAQTAYDNATAVGASISNVMGAAADGLKALAEDAAESGKSSSRGLFAAYKAAAISQAVIDGALAISGIWAQFSAYPPVAAALTAGAAAVSGVQIATIAAEEPSFHRGGIIAPQRSYNRAPDEVGANLMAGESVLNTSATARLGASGVNALNAGGSMSPTVVVAEYRNQIFRAQHRDASRRDGSPLKDTRRRRGGRRYGR